MRGLFAVGVVALVGLACGGSTGGIEISTGVADDSSTGVAGGSSGVASESSGAQTSDDADTSSGELPMPDVEGGRPPIPLWHVESPPDSARAWLVSPAGERVFWLGVNTVMRDKTCDGILDWIRRTDPTTAANVEWARLSTGDSGSEHNDAPYCFNSVGAFSDTNDFGDDCRDSWMIRAPEDGGAGAPYGIVLSPAPRTDDGALRNESATVLRNGLSEARVGDPW
ncbi:MAG TPA: hypothetical protein VFG69_09455, partial [Nannocystaceae bacterium]|nr:hypothetical protein [Nannocystaceae bacterium]